MLLECIPPQLGKAITEALDVPVIGIGAGPDTDGQILVLYDVLDITSGRKPRFVQNFMQGAGSQLRCAEGLRGGGEAARLSRRPSTASMPEALVTAMMTVDHDRRRARAGARSGAPRASASAFVPTMGNLHAGTEPASRRRASTAIAFVASIFVNPLQFGPNEDFARYPRTPDEDAQLLGDAGCDLLFMPDGGRDLSGRRRAAPRASRCRRCPDILCGEFRPGHFDGVATVVAKLFNIVQPDVAVFGEKDYPAARRHPPHGRGPVHAASRSSARPRCASPMGWP